MAFPNERLIEAREADGRSVLELASQMRVQTAEIYAVESGRRGAGPKLLRRYVDAGLLTWEEVAEHVVGPRPTGEAAA